MSFALGLEIVNVSGTYVEEGIAELDLGLARLVDDDLPEEAWRHLRHSRLEDVLRESFHQ